MENETTWADVRDAVRRLNLTLDLVAMLVNAESKPDLPPGFEQLFGGRK